MFQAITSVQNQRIKNAVKLRQHRGRTKQGRIIIDGAREILRAIEAGVQLVEVFSCSKLCVSDDSQRALAAADRTGAEMFDVAPAVFGKLAFGQRAEGIVAVATTPTRTLASLPLTHRPLTHRLLTHRLLTHRPLVAVVEGVEKPGNVGAVIRSADGAGLSAVIVSDGGTDLYNPNTIRASLGTIFSLPVCSAASAETRDWLFQHNFQIFAARVDDGVNYTDVDFTAASAVVLGSESHGLSPVWNAAQVTAIHLPMLGAADSLNISAAAAVLFYEALRKRQSFVDTPAHHP